mmetsp:Transcript_1945/g.2755  ORF Transcript_1945/g.2755 Transcript_1945/m.2755 type:complete len:394 (+) Transcript_1945:186-1367(+)
MILVIIVGTINIAIFASLDNVLSKELASMHLPSMHLPDSNEDKRHSSYFLQEVTLEGLTGNIQKKRDDNKADENNGETANNEDTDDKERIIDILERAGETLNPEEIADLPTWSSVMAQYGSEPVIVGLDTCEQFQSMVPKEEAWIAPAGLFNTGTNLISLDLTKNCYLPKKEKKYGTSGVRWQVPWGKHTPATWRLKHRAESKWARSVNITSIFPIVTIKDPYHWMGSMCRKNYEAIWPHTQKNCPNLIKEHDNTINEVQVKYSKTDPSKIVKHESLVGLWNDYNRLYADASFPRLIVRYEDLVFHHDYVVSKVCECAGGSLRPAMKILKNNAKGIQQAHASANDLKSAIMRYGSIEKRGEGFSDRDLSFAESKISKELMDLFGYKIESNLIQ